MATKRGKKTVVLAPISREEAEAQFAQYSKADAEMEQIKANIEIQCTKYREKWQNRLGELEEQRTSAFDRLQEYARQNPDQFAKRKSLDLTHGTIGYRTGTPKLKTLKGFTWGACLQLVKEFIPGFIRTTEDIDKAGIIASRQTEGMDDDIRHCGMQIVQDESFFVERHQEQTLLPTSKETVY